MLGQIQVKVGQRFSCKYPRHGVEDVLSPQDGEIESQGFNTNGEHWLRIKRTDGKYRTLQAKKMVNPTVR